MKQELLPCPWCGENEYGVGFSLNDIGNHVITCHYCGVEKCEQMPREINQAAQIVEWNGRPAEDALQARVQLLAKALQAICQAPKATNHVPGRSYESDAAQNAYEWAAQVASKALAEAGIE